MIDTDSAGSLDTFYVFRSLHSDETWGAILAIQEANKLPNVDFGMKIFAKNEKEAIARGRDLYEKIHKWDSDKDNIRRFAAAALKSVSAKLFENSLVKDINNKRVEAMAKMAMRLAIATNREYTKHFKDINNENVK